MQNYFGILSFSFAMKHTVDKYIDGTINLRRCGASVVKTLGLWVGKLATQVQDLSAT